MHHVLSINDPRIDLFTGVADPSICAGIMDSARDLLAPSTVVSHDDGSSIHHDCRTSRTAYLPASWLWLSHSLARMLGFHPDQCETPQVQCYAEGTQYVPHHDYFYLGGPGGQAQIARGGQRIATAILYLNTVPMGGHTEFPELGLSVRPMQGSLLAFRYSRNGQPDTRLFHAGRPVGCGYKWIVTQWFREGTFQ